MYNCSNEDTVISKSNKTKNLARGCPPYGGSVFIAPSRTFSDMYRGYFPLWRKITDWGWYKDSNTKAVFLHLLLTANHKESHFLGHKILRGQCVHGIIELSKNLGLSISQIRTAIKHLKLTSEVTIHVTNRFSVYSLCNFNKYLPNSIPNRKPDDNLYDKPIANQSQADDNPIATSNNDNNIKNDKDIEVNFNLLWDIYPIKEGKKQAFSHYKSALKEKNKHEDVKKALENYLIKVKTEGIQHKFILHGKTFFNNWKDYLDYNIKTQTSRSDKPYIKTEYK